MKFDLWFNKDKFRRDYIKWNNLGIKEYVLWFYWGGMFLIELFIDIENRLVGY